MRRSKPRTPRSTARVRADDARECAEKAMGAIWSEIFGIESIGAQDNFFELGGNSFIAANIASRIEQVTGVELTFDAIFEYQTITELCQHLRSRAAPSRARET